MILKSNDLLKKLLENHLEITNTKEYTDDYDCFEIQISEPCIDDFISTLKEEIIKETMKLIK